MSLIVASVTWKVKGRHLLYDMLSWVPSLIMASPTYKPFSCVIWSIWYWLVIVGAVMHASPCSAWMLSPSRQLSGLCSSPPNTSVNTVFNAHSSLNQKQASLPAHFTFSIHFRRSSPGRAQRTGSTPPPAVQTFTQIEELLWPLLFSFWKASHRIRRHNCNSL